MSTSEQSLVTVPNGMVTTPSGSESISQFEGTPIEQMPLVIENVSLVQAQSDIPDGIVGTFHTKHGAAAEIFAIPIAFKTKRVRFAQGKFQRGSKPLCRSNDGVRPAPSIVDPPSDVCKTCRFGDMMWGAYSKTGIKPHCAKQIEFTYLNRITMAVQRQTISGTSLSDFNAGMKDLQGKLGEEERLAKFQRKTAILAKVADGMDPEQAEKEVGPLKLDLGLDSFVFHFKPIKVSGDNGIYYVIRTSTALVKPIEREALREEYNLIREQLWERRMLQQVADSDSVVDEYGAEQGETVDQTAPAEEPVIEA